jgi:hypothetical protein
MITRIEMIFWKTAYFAMMGSPFTPKKKSDFKHAFKSGRAD